MKILVKWRVSLSRARRLDLYTTPGSGYAFCTEGKQGYSKRNMNRKKRLPARALRSAQSPSSHDASLSTINYNAAGIDIGADRHWVSVPTGRDSECVRSFGCFTAELYAMADWLKHCGI